MTKKNVAYYTLGCKLNFAETSAIAKQFELKGYSRVNEFDKCEIAVINTCSVTALAEKKGRAIISKIRKHNPNAKIAVTGCYVQISPEVFKELDIDFVIDNNDKGSFVEIVENNIEYNEYHKYTELNSFHGAISANDRTRTFLKIQDGCDYFCSYCVIPLARGLSRSPMSDDIINQVKSIVNSNSKEIILTGVNIGDFGRKNGESFELLLNKIVNDTGLKRLRISSIEPNLLTENIIELASQDNCVMPHFHIPLQCGTNDLLKAMNRRYTVELFESRVAKIKQLFPNACIAADIIVGVPGETEEHHIKAMEFVKRIRVSYLHVFTYSERKGTKAVDMQNPVPMQVRHMRSKQMHEVSQQLLTEFINNSLNAVHDVLFEKIVNNGYVFGFTDNYIRVRVVYSEDLPNTIRKVYLKSLTDNNIIDGELVQVV